MLTRIDPSKLECYQNLSQHYEAEFSPLTGKVPNEYGLYAITPLDQYHIGYLCYLEPGRPIGFVVIDIGRPRLDIAEFYVIPTARRLGWGKKIARAAFQRYPGEWQVRQITGADVAHRFWLAAIQDFCGENFSNEVADDPEWGRVRIQKFISPQERVGRHE